MSAPSRLVRIFISSTFRDFLAERDELVKKVFAVLRRRCKDRFVELLVVDLRRGITGEQGRQEARSLLKLAVPLFQSCMCV